MLIARICMWVLMMTFPAYFTTTLILKYHPQATLPHTARSWLHASLCSLPPEYYHLESHTQAYLTAAHSNLNLNLNSPFPFQLGPLPFSLPFALRVSEDLDDGLPYDSEWRRAMARKLYKGTETTSWNAAGGYVLRRHQLVEPKATLEPEGFANTTDVEWVGGDSDWDDWSLGDVVSVFRRTRKPRHMELEKTTWSAISLELLQFVLVMMLLSAIVLGIAGAVSIAVEWFFPDEKERKVPVVENRRAGEQHDPMIVVPGNAPPRLPGAHTNYEDLSWRNNNPRRQALLLPQDAAQTQNSPGPERGLPGPVPGPSQPTHALEPRTRKVRTGVWIGVGKGKGKGKGKERAAEMERKSGALTAAAELQKRRNAHQSKHLKDVMGDIKEKKAAKQREQFNNRFEALAGSDDGEDERDEDEQEEEEEEEVMLD